MESFRVWVQPMDYEYRVSVDGAGNANWLIDELSRSFVFKSALPLVNDGELYSFQVPYNSLLPFAVFRKILAAIPSVRLTMRTARTFLWPKRHIILHPTRQFAAAAR
jgi:hypothetical protein